MNAPLLATAVATPAKGVTLESGAAIKPRAPNVAPPETPFAALLQRLTGVAPPPASVPSLLPSGAASPLATEERFDGARGWLDAKRLGSMSAADGRSAVSLRDELHAARPAYDEPTDPIHRQHATLSPPETLLFNPQVVPLAGDAACASASSSVAARASLEELLPALVRRIAWSGDGRRGSVRIEIGAGALAGATLVVHADEGRVRVHLTTPAGADADAWGQRIRERLAKRNVKLEQLEIDG